MSLTITTTLQTLHLKMQPRPEELLATLQAKLAALKIKWPLAKKLLELSKVDSARALAFFIEQVIDLKIVSINRESELLQLLDLRDAAEALMKQINPNMSSLTLKDKLAALLLEMVHASIILDEWFSWFSTISDERIPIVISLLISNTLDPNIQQLHYRDLLIKLMKQLLPGTDIEAYISENRKYQKELPKLKHDINAIRTKFRQLMDELYASANSCNQQVVANFNELRATLLAEIEGERQNIAPIEARIGELIKKIKEFAKQIPESTKEYAKLVEEIEQEFIESKRIAQVGYELCNSI